jgi:ubiquinone/menaquinone biosynthesis C-methylase UbiE
MTASDPIQISSSPASHAEQAAAGYESSVRARYSLAAQAREAALCCPVDYDRRYLEVIPTEVIERDYGCGDPSRYVRPGETVLDLGSGGGKICFIAAQVVGAEGRVIGVDMNDEMLELARRSAPRVADELGYANVAFHKAKIQDLALDRDALDGYLREHPIRSEADLQACESHCEQLRQRRPLIADDSIDAVVSNCVLNLVDPTERGRMFAELFRVLKPGGRAVISDIVSDRPVPLALQRDAELWSGCISGAYQQTAFLDAFTAAGFVGPRIADLQSEPWQTVAGIEFRSMTVVAYKPTAAAADDAGEATTLVYRGPFASVTDDAGRSYRRGEPFSVRGTERVELTTAPYGEHFGGVDSSNESACGDQGCC